MNRLSMVLTILLFSLFLMGPAKILLGQTGGVPWAWGWDAIGQLGNGTKGGGTNRNIPIEVSNLTDVIAFSGGTVESLALKSDGTVWAWGYNNNGQLGNGTNVDSNLPVQVLNLIEIIAIAGDADHSLALKNDGTVWAWGANGDGELGNGTNYDSNVPVQVLNLTDVTGIAGSGDHSLALKNDGTVWAWGRNGQGELGNGTYTFSNLPVQVLHLIGVTAISSNHKSCLALKNDGTVWAWGENTDGQLGNGTSGGNSNVPVRVSNLSGITAIAGGNGSHFLALKNDKTVWAWGDNENGQLGNGTTTNSNVPIQVPNLTGVAAIAAGDWHSLVLKNDGTVWAWGDNTYGELGNGEFADGADESGACYCEDVPVRVLNLTDVTAISAGGGHSLAATTSRHSRPVVRP